MGGIKFKRDSGECKGIPYVELINTESGLMNVHKVRKYFEGYNKQEVEKSKLARELKLMVGHPT